MVDEDPSRSMRSIARELQVSEGTVRKCLHEYIRYKSYKMRKGQLLSAKMQEDRFKKSKMLNKLKFPLENDMLWFFSDEKNFCQDQTHNSQNNRWLAVCPKDVPRGMKGMQVSCNCHGVWGSLPRGPRHAPVLLSPGAQEHRSVHRSPTDPCEAMD